MQTKSSSRKYVRVFAIALLIVLVGAACAPVGLAVAPAQTVVVVQQIITQEVTRIVYVPVTITPTPTEYTSDTPTITPLATGAPSATSTPPTTTATPQPPTVTVLVHTTCLFGPDPAYISMYDILANSVQIAIGRNPDTSWLLVQGSDHKTPCWIKAGLVKLVTGNYTDPPVVSPVLTPYTTLYPAPEDVSATRNGDVVTIFWQPGAMSQADYNGYLVEAWVCQGGQMVFVPKSFPLSYDKNAADVKSNIELAVNVTDEPGCATPSSAQVYAVTTNAYTKPMKVLPWPAAPTPTP